MTLWITIKGQTITFEQMLRLAYIKKLHGTMTWHPNVCGCCLAAHTAEGDYLIGPDGDYDFFAVEVGEQ